MLETVWTFLEKHVTPTREMTRILAKCSHCGEVSEILKQNADKHNRLKRTHCALCVVELDHNMTHTSFYRIWRGMRWRCESEASKDYANYGGRGITVCAEWSDFKAFYNDMHPSYSQGLTIERVDVNGPYTKVNCTWVTPFAQQSNKRNNRKMIFLGEELHLAEVCRRSGIGKIKLVTRLDRGLTADQAVWDAMTPIRDKQRIAHLSMTS